MYELRPYQKSAINQIKAAFSRGKKRILVCSPTGSGKGVMLSHIINSAAEKGSSVLFLVHRREIVNQVSDYMDHYGIDHGVIMAGDYYDPRYLVNLASIQTIVRRMEHKTFQPADIIIIDECFPAGTLIDGKPIETLEAGDMVQSFNVNTGEIEAKKVLQVFKNPIPRQLMTIHLESGESVTCTPNHPFYVDNQWKPAASLQSGSVVHRLESGVMKTVKVSGVETYESTSERGSTELRGNGFVYNFEVEGNNNYFANQILVHNCHHATASTYLKVIEAFQKKLLIGFTATPCRKTGMGLGNLFDELVTVATIPDLVADGFLVPTRYYAPFTPDLSGVKITAGDYDEKQLNMVMLQGQVTAGIVENWKKYGQDRQTICFTTTVAHSVALCEAFNAEGIPSYHLDGKSSLEERTDVLKRYRNNEIRVLCNCAVFTEGVDIPQISCVIMARPTKSLSLYLQCIGRGMRISPGKADMLLLDHSGVYWEHGPVEEITEWTLDATTKVVSEKNEQRKEKNSKSIDCKKCGILYSGQLQCPDCGTKPDIKRYGEDVDYIDGVLGEIVYKGGIGKKQKKPPKREPTKEEKQAFYSQLLMHCYNKNYSHGWAAHAYKEHYGVFPRGLTTDRAKITNELVSWLKYRAIKAAKSKGSDRVR